MASAAPGSQPDVNLILGRVRRHSIHATRVLAFGGVFAGIVVAYVWVTFGGLSRGFDHYGALAVPGREVVRLPAGTVTLDFENDLDLPGDPKQAAINSPPSGMRVRVTSVSDPSRTLPLRRIPTWLFVSVGETRGHEPFAQVSVPSSGHYLVEAGDDDAPLPARPDPAIAATPDPGSGPMIAVGESPWTPFGSRWAGAILAGILVALVLALPDAGLRRLRRSG